MIRGMKYLLPLLIMSLFLIPSASNASSPTGLLIKGTSSPAVYFAYNEKRFAFPNESVYKSWYEDFDSVVEVPDSELATLQLGGNITYRPGSLVKIATDPKVYLVSRFGTIHWITTEEIAKALYWDNWNTKVRDVADTFFLDYTLGDPIETTEKIDFDTTTAIKQLAQNMKERHAPILTVLDTKPNQNVTVRLDAPTGEEHGWSTIVEGSTRNDPMLAICEYTWCEITLRYFGTVNYTAFTTLKDGSNELVQSNTITLTP